MNSPVVQGQQAGANIVWPRTEQVADSSPAQNRAVVPRGSVLPDTPAGQIERILREYASECYAVGRGESMYYLVEDLPRIAHAATHEILAVRPQGVADRWRVGLGIPSLLPSLPPAGGGASAPNEAVARSVKNGTGPLIVGKMGPAAGKRGARSVVGVLPVLTVLAAFGLTVLLAVAAL